MDIKCECGKLLCRYKDGYFYLYCKSCKEEKKIPINKIIVEPKSQNKF